MRVNKVGKLVADKRPPRKSKKNFAIRIVIKHPNISIISAPFL